jgi:hypothetical protein
MAIDLKKLKAKAVKYAVQLAELRSLAIHLPSAPILGKRFQIDDHRQLSSYYFLLLLVATSAMPTTSRTIATGIAASVWNNRKIKATKTSRPIPPMS